MVLCGLLAQIMLVNFRLVLQRINLIRFKSFKMAEYSTQIMPSKMLFPPGFWATTTTFSFGTDGVAWYRSGHPSKVISALNGSYLDNIKKISAGNVSHLFLKSDGTVWNGRTIITLHIILRKLRVIKTHQL